MIMNFIEPLQKTTEAELKYILHIMNYFSCYSLIYLSIIVYVTDIIKVLENVFHWFFKSDIFFIDWDHHFENQLIKNYLKEQKITVMYSFSESFKSFDFIEQKNQILKDIIRKSVFFSKSWDAILSEFI